MTSQDFIAKLAKIKWEASNDFKRLSSKDGWELITVFQFNQYMKEGVQAVLQLRRYGIYIQTWGCTEEDQLDVLGFLFKANAINERAETDKKNELSRTYKNNFDKL